MADIADQNTDISKTPQRATLSRRWMGLAAVATLLSALLYFGLNTLFLQSESRDTPNRAQFFANTIDDALGRLEHLPYVVSIDRVALEVLTGGSADKLNPVLADIARRSEAEFIFVMDVDGKTVASSNYQSRESLVGQFYTFRPYFQDAMAGRVGRFYAVGVTTGRPGYFMAEPVRDAQGIIQGAVVVKISLADLSKTWADSGELIFVTDPQGVVLASSQDDLVFRLTEPLADATLRDLQEQKKFGDRDLSLLDWQTTGQTTGQTRARLNGTSYLWTTAQIEAEDWTLHLLSDLQDIRTRAMLFVALALAGVLALGIALTVLRSAQLKQALSLSNADRARLALEIDERRAAEIRLREAQDELARKDRLATLGRLSASITHELGQPISAMRNYLAAEEISADKLPGQLAPQMTGLVNRMQRIVDQLRAFGRQSPENPGDFSLSDAVEGAIGLVRHDAETLKVEITTTLDNNLRVTGSQAKFEQVVINLLRNGIDAVEDRDAGTLAVELLRDGGTAILRVTDNGPGIGTLEIADLQEPFFTTKPSGRGMGLGLAISAQIIDEIGGRITAENAEKGGAVFTISLPLSEGPDGA